MHAIVDLIGYAVLGCIIGSAVFYAFPILWVFWAYLCSFLDLSGLHARREWSRLIIGVLLWVFIMSASYLALYLAALTAVAILGPI